MEKLKPIYMKKKDGTLIPISAVLGVEDSKKPLNFADYTVAKLNPELVITEEEFYKRVEENAKKRYEIYQPIVNALKSGPLTLQQINQTTGRPIGEDREYLERLYGAKLIEKKGEVYSITDENLKEIIRVFGTV